ncbi:hypothetical protein ACFL4Q_02770 [candidate division KSB1 bacterium]
MSKDNVYKDRKCLLKYLGKWIAKDEDGNIVNSGVDLGVLIQDCMTKGIYDSIYDWRHIPENAKFLRGLNEHKSQVLER